MRIKFIALAAAAALLANSAHAVVGRTPGTFSVAPTGAAKYAIPIWTPPGPNGLQPRLSIVYSSQSNASFLGYGWSLAGLSSITRCGLTLADDGTPAPVTLSYADRFCIDGSRLRLTSGGGLGTYGQNGTTYQTEIADFSLVTATGTTGNGPSTFSVKTKDGLTYEYGNGSNSQIITNNTVTQWLLNKVTDRSGNTMKIAYLAPNPNLQGMTAPDTISWTATTSGGSTYQNQIVFSYLPNTVSPTIGYYNGTPVFLAYRLYGLNIQSNGTTVKNYVLDYAIGPTTNRYTLSSVKECADAAATNCLPATTFAYEGGTLGLNTLNTSQPTGSGTTNGTTNTGDFNGDGKADLLFATTSGATYQWWVQFSIGNGFAAPINTGAVTPGAANALVDDFDGNGISDLLAPSGATWFVYKWNGTSFTATSTGLVAAASSTYSSADVNGDGLPDLAYVSSTAGAFDYNMRVHLNTTSSGSTTFGAVVTTALQANPTPCLAPYQPCPQYTVLYFYGNNQWKMSSTKQFDFDGDGRQDLMMALKTVQPRYMQPSITTYSLITLLARGSGPFVGHSVPYNTTGSYTQVQPLSWNDDPCTDVEVDTKIYISACGTAPASVATIPTSAFMSLDWDGDGRSDLIAQTTSGHYRYTYGNDITIYNFASITGSPVIMDIDGDGLDDAVGASNFVLYYSLHKGAGVKPDILKSVTDGYGVTTAWTSTSIAQSSYTRGSGASYPEQDLQNNLYVVKDVTLADGAGGTYTRSYSYSGLRKNIQGRGLEGFQSRTVTDSRATAPMVKSYFSTAFPTTGMLTEEYIYQHDGATPIAHATYSLSSLVDSTLDGTTNNQRYFPKVTGKTTYTYEVGGTTKNGQLIATSTSALAYDSYGNIVSSTTTLTDNDTLSPASPTANQSWTTSIASTISPDTTYWCLGLPTQVVVSQSSSIAGETTVAQTKNFSVDYVKCRITQQVVAPGSATYQVTTAYAYDDDVGNAAPDFGNVTSTIVTGVNMTPRTSSTVWSSTGQFPTQVVNALGHVTLFGFDANKAVLTNVTDPNGLRTSWLYDEFLRKTRQTRPDNTYRTYSYSDCVAVAYCAGSIKTQLVEEDKDNGGNSLTSSTSYLDRFDRLVENDMRMLSGEASQTKIQYDSFGRVSQQSSPCVASGGNCATTYWTIVNYDALGRAVQVQRPLSSGSGSATTSYQYLGLTFVETDAKNHKKTVIRDAKGLPRQITDDANYSIKFAYDAAGSKTGVTDSLNNALWSGTYVYGAAPFNVTATDTDLGSWTYTYNALGEKIAWTDAKNQIFTAQYDALSRMTKRIEPDLVSDWTWGTGVVDGVPSRDIGQLRAVSAGPYSETFAFDSLARLQTRQITADSTYQYDYAYDTATGFLDSLTYPTSTSAYRFKLKYNYQNGVLKSLADANGSTVFWTANASDAGGRFTQETFANNVVNKHSFDPVTGLVNSIQSGAGGTAALQNQSYLFDAVGNLTQRQDYIAGSTENAYYDNLNRLDFTTLNNGTSTTTNNDISYDAMGNILTWGLGSVNNFNYTPQSGCPSYANPQIHAVHGNVQSIWTRAICYDANGNVTTSTTNGTLRTTNTWTSYNQPNVMSAYGDSSQFFYDANHQRWKQLATYSGVSEVTRYIGSLMEVVTTPAGTAYRHYIPAGNNTVLYTRSTTGTNSTYYITKDHLGSTALITDAAGARIVQENFPAAGFYYLNTGAEQSTIGGISRRGFTGHEMIGNLFGVNMNGRVYSTGSAFLTFQSPDPTIPDPSNTQAYNRYSYVYNNPLSHTDPTGFCEDRIWCFAISFSFSTWAYGRTCCIDTSSQDRGYRIPDKNWIRKEGIQGIAANAPETSGVECDFGPCSSGYGGTDETQYAALLAIIMRGAAAGDAGAVAIVNFCRRFPLQCAAAALIAVEMASSGSGTDKPGPPMAGASESTTQGPGQDPDSKDSHAAANTASARELGRALEQNSGQPRPPGSAAHHIVAGNARAAAPARAALQRVGIGINEATNGTFLPASQHQALHTAKYYQQVNNALADVQTRGQAQFVLDKIARGLRAGTFP